MPRNSGGSYQQPTGTSAVYNTTIDPNEYNTLITDLGNEITNSLDRQGRSAMLAALAMGGFKITGMANGSALTDAATMGNLAGFIPSGTSMLFAQAAAPTGWTQVTTTNDYALRVVSGTGAVTHGTVGLSTFVTNGALGHVLTTNEMPSHNHIAYDNGHQHSYIGSIYYGYGGGSTAAQGSTGNNTALGYANITVNYNGGSAAHTHALSDLQYYDVIIATKN